MEPSPSDNLFIADLANSLTPDDMTEAKLREIFEAYGTVSSIRPMPPGAALVRFATQDEATWVRDNLDGNIPQGLTSPVSVKYANSGAKGTWGKSDGQWGKGDGQAKGAWSSPYDGKGAAKGKGKGKGGKGVTTCSMAVLKDGLVKAEALPGGRWSHDGHALFVGGLPRDTTDIDLYQIFSCFGAIPAMGVRAMVGQDGVGTGIGFVNFLDQASCQLAIATLHGTVMPDGCILEVKPKGPSKSKGKGKGGNDFQGQFGQGYAPQGGEEASWAGAQQVNSWAVPQT
eukprot:CAMPEP_0170597044 /NCGR_PEP_ID=MMETSP0224-20130122/15485_1 /TAXON_ID=285029 /ORGANISM="Togula jolla, Strain CCCM 725" /LENGTH=284 /DNA_ID=CAMNT_0010921465 /DNA_START=54 /DNA_END=908 /DNA_ORIENTATION=+